MNRLIRMLMVTSVATACAMAGRAYSAWSTDRHLRAVAANAAAPGIPLDEFERRHTSDKRGTPRAAR